MRAAGKGEGKGQGEAQCSRITFKTVHVDAYKPVSTVKLMAQKPNRNLELRHKNSVPHYCNNQHYLLWHVIF
jgi:hypothetical protein